MATGDSVGGRRRPRDDRPRGRFARTSRPGWPCWRSRSATPPIVRRPPLRGDPAARSRSFAGAMVVLLVALTWPVADLAAHWSLTALVLQRLLLTLAVPPLLLLGLPAAAGRGCTRPAPVDAVARAVSRPPVAVAVVTVDLRRHPHHRRPSTPRPSSAVGPGPPRPRAAGGRPGAVAPGSRPGTRARRRLGPGPGRLPDRPVDRARASSPWCGSSPATPSTRLRPPRRGGRPLAPRRPAGRRLHGQAGHHRRALDGRLRASSSTGPEPHTLTPRPTPDRLYASQLQRAERRERQSSGGPGSADGSPALAGMTRRLRPPGQWTSLM